LDGTLGEEYKIEDLYRMISEHFLEIDGITFSGGEPLYQSEELIEFLNLLPNDLDTLLFTGYDYLELNASQKACYERFDLVIEGRFDISKMGNFLWRGSSNQKIISPTKKYHHLINNLLLMQSGGLQINVNDGEMLFYGIPTDGHELYKIKKILQKNKILNTANF
jgi:organic radical activating enzyme